MDILILFLLILAFATLNLTLGTFIYRRHKAHSQEHDDKIETLQARLDEIEAQRKEPNELEVRLAEINKEFSELKKHPPIVKKKKENGDYEEVLKLQKSLLDNNYITEEQMIKVQHFQKLNGINFENALTILGLLNRDEIEKAKSEIVAQ